MTRPARAASGWMSLCAGVALALAGCTSSVTGASVPDSTRLAVSNSVGGTDWATVGPPSPGAEPSALTSTVSTSRLAPMSTSSTDRPSATTSAALSTGSTTSRSGGRTVGDLGLAEQISTVDCDGEWIVLLGSAANPKTYAADVQHLLQVHPGSHYLRTDRACTSLTQRTEAGGHIYAVYFGPHDTIEKACQVLALTGQDAQVRKLANTAEPLDPEKC